MSKLLGEYAALAYCPKSLVIRTCGLYGIWGSGGKGGNFVETMLRVAAAGKPLRVVADQFCTPSSTADVARAAVALIARTATGLFHVTNAGACSWFEFASEIFRQSGLTPDLGATTSAAYAAPARRPPYSVLSNAKLAALGVEPPQAWAAALGEYLRVRQQRLTVEKAI